MTRSQLVEFMAAEAGLTKAAAASALAAFEAGVKKGLKSEGAVAITGFGTFKATKRAARDGRNPATGAALHIPARVVPTFKAGSSLKAELN